MSKKPGNVGGELLTREILQVSFAIDTGVSPWKRYTFIYAVKISNLIFLFYIRSFEITSLKSLGILNIIPCKTFPPGQAKKNVCLRKSGLVKFFFRSPGGENDQLSIFSQIT